ncbi:uncharacterized protein MELLADRAFT_72913 [Melampsora larici-populina 98AG31]
MILLVSFFFLLLIFFFSIREFRSECIVNDFWSFVYLSAYIVLDVCRIFFFLFWCVFVDDGLWKLNTYHLSL